MSELHTLARIAKQLEWIHKDDLTPAEHKIYQLLNKEGILTFDENVVRMTPQGKEKLRKE